LRSLQATFTIPALPARNFRNDPACGGGAFHDLSRYPLSAALSFFSGQNYLFQGKAEYAGKLLMALHGSAVTEKNEQLNFSIGFGLPYCSSYELSGEKGLARVDRAFTIPADLANKVAVTIAGQDESFIVPPADHFLLTLEDVCALLETPELFSSIRTRNEELAALADNLYRSCHAG
jgi:hypothetical protein